ncbi:MAG TPA: N-acetylmuramoyl-L-alanine amidase [Coriobacteriaceae bacterium]|nr:N-acetylmuramoyl-L-alanine amidase [Coriobacteriaceae bacterium]
MAAAYAASNVPSADAAVDAATADDDGEASRDAGSVDVDAADDSSPATNVDESADEDFGVDVSENHQQAEPVDSSFQYVYLAYPSLSSGTDQVVAFATPDDGDSLASATLNYVSANGVQGTIEASATADNSAAFIFGSQLESNTYFLTSITYALQGDGSEHEVDLSDRDYSFTVINGSVSSEGTSVYYADGDGNAVEAQSIQQALECADSPDGISTYAERSARNVGVIALDAGHGGVDSGAQGNGKSEADLTWKIMTACKNKLEAYGFKIVLAREQSGYYPSNDYLYRVQRCIDQGAQAFVSFHINSGSSGAHGAEVYAPTANGTDYTQVSVELANKVMNNLAAMGLTYRGVFQMEVGDEFAVIRCAREQGIPGILIEHGFISNYGDVANYFSDDGCRRLGEADAAAIIAQFPHPYSVNGISFSEELGHAGSTVKIGVNVSGKTDGLRYKFVWHRAGSDWSDSNWGVIGQDLTSPSISWTLPQAGEYEIYADVIDSNGYVTSTSKYKVVNWSLESLEVSGDARCGKPVKLQAKVSGDASGLKYKFVWEKGGWAKWGVAQQPSASSSCEWTPTEPGEYTVYLDVIDGSAERHLTRKVTVGERYSVESLEVSGSALCGKPVKLQAKVSGDASGLKYKFVWEKGGWAKWGVAQQPSASSSCEWTPTEPGEYTVYLDVIDGSAERHLTRKVTVGERYSVESLEVSGDARCGKPVKLQAKVSGDASGLKYKFVWEKGGWAKWGVAQQPSASSSCEWTPTEPGDYTVYLDVIDGSAERHLTRKVTVGERYSVESLEVSGSALCGKPVKLQAKVSGDASGLKYKFVWEKGGWAKWGVAQQPSASSSCEWTPTEPGDYTVYLDVIDGSAERHLTRKVTVGERYSVESLEVSGSALCGKPVKLQAKVSGDASGLKYKFVWEKGGWAKWGVAQQPSASSSCEWTPTEPGEYTVYLDVIDGSAERHLTRKVTVEGTPIMGSLQTSVDAMVNLYESTGHTYPSDEFVSKGAPTIRDFCSLIVEAAVSEGVRPEVVFAQAMLETGWLQFGGSVKPNQCNFAGLGAVNQQSGGARFDDVYQGLLAQVQHLKGYATGAALNNTCVDPRYEVLQSKGFLGVAPYLEDLNGRWAVPGDTYGQNIARIISLIG